MFGQRLRNLRTSRPHVAPPKLKHVKFLHYDHLFLWLHIKIKDYKFIELAINTVHTSVLDLEETVGCTV